MEMTSRAWIIDLLHSIGEKCAICDHLSEKLDDPVAKELYLKTLKARRNEMKLLVDSVDDPNLEYWCELKHAIKSYVLATECWDAKPNDTTWKIMQESGDILAEIFSLFIGYDFGFCARCLADALLQQQNENNERS